MAARTPFPQRPEDLVQPAQPENLYDIIPLPNPPDDWMCLDYRFDKVKDCRIMKIATLRVVAHHYFWGIHWTEPKKMAKQTRRVHGRVTFLTNLWKLFYYMTDQHRPKSWEDMLNFNRDTGPRLLQYNLTPRPPPISQWFPTEPNDRTVILPAYYRPLDAPHDIPDLILQQYLYSSESFHEPTVAPQPPEQTQQEFFNEEENPLFGEEHLSPINFQAEYPGLTEQGHGFDDDELMQSILMTDPAPLTEQEQQELGLAGDLMQIIEAQAGAPPSSEGQRSSDKERSPKRRRRDISPAAPNYRGGPAPPGPAVPVFEGPVYASRQDPTKWAWMPALQPEHFAPPEDEAQIGPLFPTVEPVYDNQVVNEAVEKALMQIVYSDLDRDPSLPSTAEPVKNVTAHSFTDLLQMKIGAFNTVGNVRLSPVTFEWNPTGDLFPLRGRGPVWHGQSCATDCVIMVGMLMDVGCTKIDRANNRAAGFTEIEKAFIETTNLSWDILDENQSIRARDEFLQKFIDSQLHLKMGQPVPPWAVWSQVTNSFSQFRYHHIERVTPCKCQNAETFVDYHEGSCILPGFRKGDDKGVPVATLIERCFYARKSFACAQCGDPLGVTGERRIGQLPLRLVMTFDVKTRIRGHTQHLKFKYLDYDDKKQVAHYRWLGGVYNNEEHARVYWTDQKRGEKIGMDLMMYDSQVNQGILFGRVPAFRPEERVPLEWVNHSSIPLLFFERILDPSRELLATAHNAVYDMGSIIGRKKNVLEEHVPWTTPDPQPAEEPWERVTSNIGDRFIDYNPEWARPAPEQDPEPQAASESVDPGPVDPILIDPAVVDQSMLDPSIYNSSTPPDFDIMDFLDPAAMAEDVLTPQPPTGGLNNRLKNHMFNSMLNTPDWLAAHPEMWPSGKPSREGALEFPELPTWPSPKGKRKRRAKSDITMRDVDDRLPKQSPQIGTKLKTAVMFSQSVDPKQRAAYENKRIRMELNDYLNKVETQWWAHKKDGEGLSEVEQIREKKIEEYEARQRSRSECQGTGPAKPAAPSAPAPSAPAPKTILKAAAPTAPQTAAPKTAAPISTLGSDRTLRPQAPAAVPQKKSNTEEQQQRNNVYSQYKTTQSQKVAEPEVRQPPQASKVEESRGRPAAEADDDPAWNPSDFSDRDLSDFDSDYLDSD
ncbi:unnamed protein product [Penicillium olsonii]|nr:unnamed protein product [Penicillium olsonii]